jgi:hypothetical protein
MQLHTVRTMAFRPLHQCKSSVWASQMMAFQAFGSLYQPRSLPLCPFRHSSLRFASNLHRHSTTLPCVWKNGDGAHLDTNAFRHSSRQHPRCLPLPLPSSSCAMMYALDRPSLRALPSDQVPQARPIPPSAHPIMSACRACSRRSPAGQRQLAPSSEVQKPKILAGLALQSAFLIITHPHYRN